MNIKTDLVFVEGTDRSVEREGDAARGQDGRRRLDHVQGGAVWVEERQRPRGAEGTHLVQVTVLINK